MRTSVLTRDVIQITIVSSFLLLVSMLAREVDSNSRQGGCPNGTFDRNCRLQCLCKDGANCDDVTGECPNGCLETWSGPNCQRQNVVLGMPTDMKTPDWSKGARAVDGDLKTCVTSSSNRTGWWRVDMKAPRTIFFMEIFFANQTISPGRIRVHVSKYSDTFWGKPCTRIPASHERSKFTCDTPTTGQYFGIMNKIGQITLCEVNVYVCTNFTFGVDCSQTCHCANVTEVCHKVTGFCESGCMEGWTGTSCNKPCKGRYGDRCRHSCGHCHDNETCDHVTGTCPNGCAPGWMGPMCKQACIPGSWGVNCSQPCHHCLDAAACRPEDGVCPWRCQSGWYGYRCDQVCRPGWHGQSCEFPCGHCYGGSVCDPNEGVCPVGCEPGYEGLFCTKDCTAGRWGSNCRYDCGHCAENQTCDGINGHCARCKRGWRGHRCDSDCVAGTYGERCQEKCGHCHGDCDPKEGRCSEGCLAGYKGSHCIEKCDNGTFGAGCASTCGYCADELPCHHVTGTCSQNCAEGYQGPICNIRKTTLEERLVSPDLLTLLVACMVAVGVTMCGVISCLLIRSRRRNRPRRSSSRIPTTCQVNGGTHDLMIPKRCESPIPLRQTIV